MPFATALAGPCKLRYYSTLTVERLLTEDDVLVNSQSLRNLLEL
jgi:hypothetical protein